jgi:hypothetical protein
MPVAPRGNQPQPRGQINVRSTQPAPTISGKPDGNPAGQAAQENPEAGYPLARGGNGGAAKDVEAKREAAARGFGRRREKSLTKVTICGAGVFGTSVESGCVAAVVGTGGMGGANDIYPITRIKCKAHMRESI